MLATGGLAVMFLFALGVLGLVYFVFLKKTGFDLTVKGVPAGSDILVDKQRWSLTSPEPGTYKLPGLKARDEKTIEINAPGFTCKPMQITGEDGVPKELVAQCTQTIVKVPPPNDCKDIKKGDFAKASKCAHDALKNLPDPFTIQQLLDAMNMYIINFPSGKFDIVKPEDKAFLQEAAGYIKKLPPNVMIEVGGHTDNVGAKDKNQTLSDNRAKSVKTALTDFGVKDSILQTRGYGDSKPKSPNTTEDGKFQNRRIEYKAILQ
jgi:outer membrane protein OmpA-like peptidoglycan-associated protein